MNSIQEEPIVIDLDKNSEDLIQQVTEIFQRYASYLQEGDMALPFILRKSGQEDKEFVYNLTQGAFHDAEKDVAFPVVVQEILKKEFPPKIAKNKKLVQHVMSDLKEDPYWSSNIINLLDAIEANK